MITLNIDTYPKFVRCFYAAIEHEKSDMVIKETLKGISITLTPSLICKILDIRDSGISLFSKDWVGTYDTDLNSIYSNIFLCY